MVKRTATNASWKMLFVEAGDSCKNYTTDHVSNQRTRSFEWFYNELEFYLYNLYELLFGS